MLDAHRTAEALDPTDSEEIYGLSNSLQSISDPFSFDLLLESSDAQVVPTEGRVLQSATNSLELTDGLELTNAASSHIVGVESSSSIDLDAFELSSDEDGLGTNSLNQASGDSFQPKRPRVEPSNLVGIVEGQHGDPWSFENV